MSQPRIRITSIGGSGDGQKGDPGDSAYQVALNNGFIGTEQQWLDSLIGAGGAKGDPGDQGIPGDQGLQGDIGAAGESSRFLGTWNSVTAFLAEYQGGQGDLPAADWWGFVKDNTNPNKIYVVREDINSATGWVIDDNEHFVLPQGPQGDPGTNGADGTNGETGPGFGIYYLGNYNPNNGYLPDIAVVRGSDGQLYLAKASGQLGDPINYQTNGQWEIWIPKGADGANGAKGDQGDPGTPGADGSDGADGADGADALWNYLGEYNGGLIYTAGDVVTYNGQLWYRNVYTSAGYVPGGPEGYWDLLAAKGVDGSDGAKGDQGDPGPQGIQGEKGDKGDTGNTGPAGGFGYYGSFYDVLTQQVVQGQESIGIPALVRNIDADATSGFTIVDNSKIKAQYPGVYNFAFSFQWYNTGGGGNGTTVEVWFTKNGQQIPDSNTRVAVNTNSPYVVSAWNIFQKMNANDYVQMYWATDNHHIVMKNNTGLMGGPAIPSAIITVNQVG